MSDPVREICRERCAQAGDPPCYRFDDADKVPFLPCSECLADAGLHVEVAQDPNAVIRPLF